MIIMYCKKCNRLIKNSSEKCPYCDFDNTVEINIISNELKEKKIPKKDTNISVAIHFSNRYVGRVCDE